MLKCWNVIATSKNLSNFWRIIELALINSKVNLMLKSYKNYAITYTTIRAALGDNWAVPTINASTGAYVAKAGT